MLKFKIKFSCINNNIKIRFQAFLFSVSFGAVISAPNPELNVEHVGGHKDVLGDLILEKKKPLHVGIIKKPISSLETMVIITVMIVTVVVVDTIVVLVIMVSNIMNTLETNMVGKIMNTLEINMVGNIMSSTREVNIYGYGQCHNGYGSGEP